MFYRFDTKIGRSVPLEAAPPQPQTPGVDARVIPLLLAAGWLLLVLGIWGAVGRPWWVWPLAVGAALLAVGAAYAWGFWQILKAKAGEPETEAGPKEKYADRFENRRSA